MLCPHCSSPRHTLCAAGFNISVELSIFNAGTDATALCALANCTDQTHLLGQTIASATEMKEQSVLIVLPVFSNTGPGAFGRTVCQSFLPDNFDPSTNKLEAGDQFTAQSGQVKFVQLPVPGNRRVSLLLIGMGPNSESFRQNICGLIGTAVESAVTGQYAQLVVPLADLTKAQLSGQQIAATVRCRLSLGIVEEHIDRVLTQLTLVATSDQVDAICHGIDIQGPLCSNCTHPRAATVRLPSGK